MSYQPLHHKYRPQTFAQLVGQEAIATTLSNALRQKRIAPAYLFTGARGTGKTSSARIFAKSLNCIATDVPTSEPCGICETCQAITNGSALDVIEIDAASNTGVDNIRELIERAQFAPVQCRYKVYVIDEVHMLSNAAFNALLKTLEEPPDRVAFILATTDPQRVLPTIISRCQRFDFRRIPLDAMVEHLGTIAHKEQIPITEDALHLVAQISQGGLRDAESLLDQLSLLAGNVTVERVWDLVGAVPERDLMALLEAISADNPETVLDTTRRLMDRGREPLIVLQNLASFYRDLLIAKTAPDRGDLVALTPPTWEKLCEFAKNLNISTILTGQQHLKTSEVQLKHTTQPRLWLEVTLLGLLPAAVNTQPAANVQSVALPIAKAKGQPKPFVESAKPKSSVVQEDSVSPKQEASSDPVERSKQESDSEEITEKNESPETSQPNLNDLWQKVITNLQPLGTQALLRQQGCLLEFDGEKALVGITSDKLLGMAHGRSANIKAAFFKTVGKEVQLSLIVSPTSAQSISDSSAPPSTDAPPSSQPFPVAETPEAVKDESSSSPSAELSFEAPSETLQSIDEILPTEILPTYVRPEWEDDEVTRAALNLADAFNGAVVDLENPLETQNISVDEQITSLHATEPEALGEEEEDEDDVEF